MLKKLSKLFLGFMVCAGSACVTPTHASSATLNSDLLQSSVILTKIQAASPVSAKDELIEIFNTSSEDVDMSGWCFANKVPVKFACFETKQEDGFVYHPILPAGAHATVVSTDYMTRKNLPINDVAFNFLPTNLSSGSLVAGSDVLTLIDANDDVVDSWSWQASAPSGKLLSRKIIQSAPLLYAVSNTLTDWQISTQDAVLKNATQWVEMGKVPGTGSDDDSVAGSDSDNQSSTLPLQITELLPNAIGSDAGNEFIELYNPNTITISGADYKLLVGANLDKSYTLPAGFTLPPLSYAIVKNDTVKYTLSNTAGAVQLQLKGTRVDIPVAYANPPEGESWANINGEWQYTSNPTPGAPNSISIIGDEDLPVKMSVQKPCASNQYRNLETGRCRLIATTTLQVPCKQNQTRSVETGRCRNNAVTPTSTPCKAGQERNIETNRCRNIVKMTKVGNGIKQAEKTQHTGGATWYVWIGIGGVVMAVISYAVWEWRDELQKLLQGVKSRIAGRANR